MNNAEQVKNALEKIHEAKRIYHEKNKVIETERDQIVKPNEQVIRSLEDKFGPIVFELAIENGHVPYMKNGYREDPYSYDVTESGISAYWFENDGPGYTYVATWQEIEERFNEELQQNN